MTTRAPLRRAVIPMAAATMAGNVIGYLLVLLLTRLLTRDAFGAVSALLSLALIGMVPAMALQLVIARRIARSPEQVALETAGRMLRLAALLGVAMMVLGALASPLIADFLHLDSPWAAIWVSAALLPTAVLFAEQGILQGSERFAALGRLYVAAALLRAGCAGAGALISPEPSAIIAGTALGATLAALAGWHWCGRPRLRGGAEPGAAREVALAAISTSGLMVLFNMDVPLARHVLDVADSGTYAFASLFSKAAFWAPQFLTTLLYPRMAKDAGRRRAIQVSLASTTAVGVLLVGATAIAAPVLSRVLGGDLYAHSADLVWLFAALGSMCVLVQALVYARLAVADRSLGIGAWIVIGVLAAAILSNPTRSALAVVTTMLAGASLLVVAGLLIEWRDRRSDPPAPDVA